MMMNDDDVCDDICVFVGVEIGGASAEPCFNFKCMNELHLEDIVMYVLITRVKAMLDSVYLS